MQAGRRFDGLRYEPDWVGVISLAADRRRPNARCRSVERNGYGVNRDKLWCSTLARRTLGSPQLNSRRQKFD
jgi:hypothetical protein